jgi:hypothetical protein
MTDVSPAARDRAGRRGVPGHHREVLRRWRSRAGGEPSPEEHSAECRRTSSSRRGSCAVRRRGPTSPARTSVGARSVSVGSPSAGSRKSGPCRSTRGMSATSGPRAWSRSSPSSGCVRGECAASTMLGRLRFPSSSSRSPSSNVGATVLARFTQLGTRPKAGGRRGERHLSRLGALGRRVAYRSQHRRVRPGSQTTGTGE